jgi:prevent-host-death family protein
MTVMGDVSIRDLRNHGGDVVDRVERGERVVVTRSGRPVAELRPLGSRGLPVAELIRRRAHLPSVDPESMRRDIDVAIDSSL